MGNELLKTEAPTPDLQLVIHNRETDKYYIPLVHDGVEVEWTRKGAPGKLTFNVQKDEILDMPEGSTVQLGYKKTNFFYGYVFEKKRNKDGVISVTAYDQLRYLKNKDIYSFVNVKAGDAIKAMAEDFQLTVGELADTGYTIPKYHGSNETLLDIVQTLIDMTMENTKKIYVLYDDFGKLTLKEMDEMKVDILIDAETAENFDYTSTIDKNGHQHHRNLENWPSAACPRHPKFHILVPGKAHLHPSKAHQCPRGHPFRRRCLRPVHFSPAGERPRYP